MTNRKPIGRAMKHSRALLAGDLKSDHALNHLDPGISKEVMTLREWKVETFESCQGGKGHAFLEPTVRFHGNRAEGMRAYAAALQSGLIPSELRRVWTVLDGELTGPCWELTFVAP